MLLLVVLLVVSVLLLFVDCSVLSSLSRLTPPKIVEIIAKQLADDIEVKDNSRFIEDLGFDSLDLVELMMALEEEFDLEIADEEAEKISTVQEAVNYINSNS